MKAKFGTTQGHLAADQNAGPGSVGSNADRRDGSAIHACRSEKVAMPVSDGDDSRLFHLLRLLADQIENAFGFGVVDCGEVSSLISKMRGMAKRNRARQKPGP
jgi:hypothetical protein